MVEILLLAIVLLVPLHLWQRRSERRQQRLDSAYDRARHVRLAGTGESGARPGIYTDRFFNPG